ncbi:solute carrier organic anion transporter family member 1B3 isoform X2 [Talpa occidentalis]|uniref:solute carrier organic anion transporter family member 1B3 isoform X2 n=1 Tax=Talpa occidentalis TaxID=50954 RepID=UPI00189070B9|nr:solute carrier organic anion transporter family member 1B3 isoform X2 [Talpa occidentalis]
MYQNQSMNNTAETQPSRKRKSGCCNGFKMFLVSLSFCFIAKALGFAVMKSSITQIERRFEIPSSIAGLIDGSFEMGNLLVIVFVSYFGSKLHRPKLIGTGCFLMGTGTILTALPHFFMGYYRYSKETYINSSENSTSSFLTCSLNQNSLLNRTLPEIVAKGNEKEPGSKMWLFVLLGNMLRGIGETPIVPLGISYIDDFSEEGQSSLYLGILNAVGMIGPIVGFIMGSQFSKMYVDIGYVDLSTIKITPKDSRWVGAWWLSFLVSGLVSIFSSIPFFFLPKSLDKPKRKKERESSISLHALKTNEETSQVAKLDNHGENITGLFQSLKSIISNPLYVFILCATLLHFNSFIGALTYNFKYLEQQYDHSPSDANILLGVIFLPTFAAGLLAGGYIIKRFKFTLIQVAKFSFSVYVISFLLASVNLMLICESKSVAGLTLTYDGNSPVATHKNIPLSHCNSDCNCDESQWEPVCGNNGITYLSPCLAGCKSSSGNKKPIVFYNCSCIEETDFQNRSNLAHLGTCPRDGRCMKKFYIYVGVQMLSNFFTSLGSTPTIMLVFKVRMKM